MTTTIPSLQPADTQLLWCLRILCESWLLRHLPQDHAISSELVVALGLKENATELFGREELNAPSSRKEWLATLPLSPQGSITDIILQQMPTAQSKQVLGTFLEGIASGVLEFPQVADAFLAIDAAIKHRE